MLSRIILLFLLISSNAFAEEQLYIMLNVDNTIVDRIDNCNPNIINELKKQNIDVQQHTTRQFS